MTSLPFFRRTSPYSSWRPSTFVWHRGIALSCDVNAPELFKYSGQVLPFHPHAYRNIGPGDTVCVTMSTLGAFCEEILPSIRHPFILVTIRGTWSVPRQLCEDYRIDAPKLLGDARLIHWFTQNHDGTVHEKLSPIPLGIDYHTQATRPKGNYGEPRQTPQKQERRLSDLLSGLSPTKCRIPMVHADFHFRDTSADSKSKPKETRSTLRRQLENAPFVRFQERRLPRTELWKQRGRYAFTISPHGKGLDCHRTWESLVLGCIVIVKTSSLDPLYEGLPVVIVDEWSEITADLLEESLKRYGEAFSNPAYRERLTLAHWVDRIKAKQREWRATA